MHSMVQLLLWKLIIIPEEMQRALQPHPHASACMHRRGMVHSTRMRLLGLAGWHTRCNMKRTVAYLSWVAG